MTHTFSAAMTTPPCACVRVCTCCCFGFVWKEGLGSLQVDPAVLRCPPGCQASHPLSRGADLNARQGSMSPETHASEIRARGEEGLR